MSFPRLRPLILLFTTAVCAPGLHAQLTLPPVLGDGMVLQRGMANPIWGTAQPGSKVEVSFAGQEKSTAVDEAGRWTLELDPLDASRDGRELQIRVGEELRRIRDVLVGEVWICSGQSNMEWSIRASTNRDAEIQNARYPRMRLFNVPGHTTAARPQRAGRGRWQVCQPAAASGFSAVGYYFGRRLLHELDVPVGLIGVNWGGTRIEPWIPPQTFAGFPELQREAARVKAIAGTDKKVGAREPAAIYNSMVHPLVPFAARGAIWYQGESNGSEGVSYFHKTRALVQGWRECFNPDLAFYWVQLANFRKPNQDPAGGDGWAKLREAQRRALSIEHTGMAVTIDIGDARDIHPRNKQDVGWRLAQWALHQTYGRDKLVPSGPLYKSHKLEGNAIRVSFDHVGTGLMVGLKRGLDPTRAVKQPLRRFAIAGADRKWHWAEAVIDGREVLVRSKEVPEPVAVRYAFSTNPEGANLYNKQGLPASPFRTDDW